MQIHHCGGADEQTCAVPSNLVAVLAVVAVFAPGAPIVSAVAPAPTAPRVVSMAFTGDALWHSPLWRQAQDNYVANHPGAAGFDFDPMLAGLSPVVAGVDLGVCHLETPIAPEGEAYSTMPRYGVPAEVVDSIAAAGFDRCSTASNHTADRGLAGIDRTVSVLEERGLGQSGMARAPREIDPHIFVADGVRMVHLSYTFSYNGLSMPDGQEWRSALIDPHRIIADARRAREQGAEVVIVSMHWGVEGASTPTASQRDVANQITAAGDIDLIVGHHAHVLQPIEQVNGTWVLYGLGNMISNLPTSSRWPAATEDGAVVVVELSVSADGTVTVATPVVHPTWVDRDGGWIVRLVQPTLEDQAISAGLRGQLETSLRRTQSIVGDFLAR